MTSAAPASGWYEDPGGTGQLRWWDGSSWTEHLVPAIPPAAVPAPVPVPAPAPVPAPSADDAASSAPPEMHLAQERGSGRSSELSGRTRVIVGVMAALIVGVAVLGVSMRGDDSAPSSAGASGPALTADQYKARIDGIMSKVGDDADLSNDSTPDDMKRAAATIRSVLPEVRAINPPAQVASEHQTLLGQLDQIAQSLDKLAANPQDTAAGTAILGTMLGVGATTQAIETKLGIKFSTGDDAAGGTSTE